MYWLEKEKENNFNSKSAEVLRSSWQEMGEMHARKKRLYAKEKFYFASASTEALNWPPFTRPLAAKKCANLGFVALYLAMSAVSEPTPPKKKTL